MAPWFGASKPVSVEELIARKKYAKAVEALREQFRLGSRDPRMRLQLAEVLVLAGKGKQAVPILSGLADEHAREGFAAKAIAALKRIERIEPGRRDVEQRLAALIHKEREPAAPALASPSRPEIGLAEIRPQAELEPPEPPQPELPELELEPAEPSEAGQLVLSEEDLTLELIEVAQATAPPAPAAGPAVASPLFSDFSEGELLAVMHGMRLLTFEAGDIIITEGEPGESLFVLSTGTVKAFVRDAAGRHFLAREMGEGSFFGEISILSGKPRTATVTAATRCELLELDRASLDGICASHPNVRSVLQQFYAQRIAVSSAPRAPRN